MNSVMLHKEIYPESAITEGIRAFASLAKIRYDQVGSYWRCVFSENRYDIQETTREFENYIIDYCTHLYNSYGLNN